MGNWRTINIVGTVDRNEVAAVRQHLTVKPDWSNFGPLSITATTGLCSLGDWPAPTVMVAGNLAERDYSVDDVAATLRGIVAVAPSARLKVHCGHEYESTTCVATITVDAGEVAIGEPEIPTVAPCGEDVFNGRLFAALTSPSKGQP